MLLADIGNSRVHIYDGKSVVHLSHEKAIELYVDKKILYITVKHQLKERLEGLENWTDVSDKMLLQNSYDTMGIDRRALCLSHKNGIFVSAGSAITVDVVEDGVYKGGFLLPGLQAYLKAYATISTALKTKLNSDISLDDLPLTTKDGISFGIIASIKMLVEKYQSDKKLYISGGDGKFLSSFFDSAIFDETLIFKGMNNALSKIY
ncbi:MAG TPA: type III pantothenate kinase [Campylobacterales bacterium]|nr:type III pantothenate kinase [Campylobacterales bacterium]